MWLQGRCSGTSPLRDFPPSVLYDTVAALMDQSFYLHLFRLILKSTEKNWTVFCWRRVASTCFQCFDGLRWISPVKFVHIHFSMVSVLTQQRQRGSSAMATSSVSGKVVTNDSSTVALHPAEGLPHVRPGEQWKKGPWLVGLYIRDYTPQLRRDYNQSINHDKDPS